MTVPTRQQRGAQLKVLSVRVPHDMIAQLRLFAREHNISINMAAGIAISQLAQMKETADVD